MGYTPPCSVWKCVEMDDADVHRRLVAASPMATWHHVVLARERMVVCKESSWGVRTGSLWVIDVGARGC